MLLDNANPLHVTYTWFEVSISSIVPFLLLVFFNVHILRQVTILHLLQCIILIFIKRVSLITQVKKVSMFQVYVAVLFLNLSGYNLIVHSTIDIKITCHEFSKR